MEIKFEDFKPAYPELLPEISKEEFEALKADIGQRGVLVPIEIDVATNEIVDGFHRHKAAVELGIVDKIPITKRQFKSEIERRLHALSLNVHRRQLTESQKAAFAAELLPLFEKHAKERQLASLKKGKQKSVKEKVPEREKGSARDQAAKAFHTNPRYVSDAKRIKEEAPEKFKKIKSGEKTISQVKAEMAPSNEHAVNPTVEYKPIDSKAETRVKEKSWLLSGSLNRIGLTINSEMDRAPDMEARYELATEIRRLAHKLAKENQKKSKGKKDKSILMGHLVDGQFISA